MLRCLPLFLLAAGLSAQTTSIFPSEYSAVAEGPYSSTNLPLANGTSRVLIVYDQIDVAVPSGRSITQLGFRQDATLTTLDTGRGLQLEIRMGYTTQGPSSLSTTFDAVYDGAPTTVFGPSLFQLPNLRDAANPLPNGQFFVTLTTPFVYAPAGRNLVVEYRVFGNSIGGASFNYRLDRADFYSPIVQGAAGCPHSGNNTTQLTASGVRTGQTLYLSGTNGPANSFALLAISVGYQLATPYPLTAVFPGIQASCTGQLDLTSLATIGIGTSSSGGFSPYYAVPNSPSLNDLWLSHQALVIDVFSPGSIVTSNGVAVQVGIAPRSSILYATGLPTTTPTGSVSANFCPVALFRWL